MKNLKLFFMLLVSVSLNVNATNPVKIDTTGEKNNEIELVNNMQSHVRFVLRRCNHYVPDNSKSVLKFFFVVGSNGLLELKNVEGENDELVNAVKTKLIREVIPADGSLAGRQYVLPVTYIKVPW